MTPEEARPPIGSPAPVGEMPPIEVGDWVMDWHPDRKPFRWEKHHGDRMAKHPAIAAYIVEVRKADGRVWRRHAEP